MRLSTPISLGLLISLLLVVGTGCQNRAPSLRMLNSRSGYGAGLDDEEVALYQRGRQSTQTAVRKSAPQVARVYIYPHELPSKDYFWGGYVSLVTSPDEWIANPTQADGTETSDTPAIQPLPKSEE